MMPYLGLGTPTLEDGRVYGETSLLGQEATQGPPILGLTLDSHLLHFLGTTPDSHLLVPTLVVQLLLILDQMHQKPTPDNQVGLDSGAYPGASPTGVPAGPLPVPYELAFPRGVMPHMLVTVMGTMKPNANRLVLDFKRGNDVAFHSNPYFNKDNQRVIVKPE